MKERIFNVIAGELNERGYAIAKSFEEVNNLTNKRTPIKIYILGMLPNEEGKVKIFKTKRDVFYGNINEITKKSNIRVIPKDDDSYLATSPFQIMNFDSEMNYKKEFLKKLYNKDIEIATDKREWEYRNKVEFGFYENYEHYSLNLSFFKREGNKGKHVLDYGSSLLPSKVNQLAIDIVKELESKKVIGKDLKTLLIRNSKEEIKANLYVTSNDFIDKYNLSLPKDVSIIFSDKKSPASNNNGFLLQNNQILTESIMNMNFDFAIDGFFQVNIGVFELVIKDLKDFLKDNYCMETLLDFYSGVGVIGLLLSNNFSKVIGVDSSLESKKLALNNSIKNNINNYSFNHAPAEKVTELINSKDILLIDPPRIGLHKDVIERIKEVKPPIIIYLSCNPISQETNYRELEEFYEIVFAKGYNFYPKTPHLESLLILKLKK
jgi:23S rRNA (uracil1939-C5)-methyltransferase